MTHITTNSAIAGAKIEITPEMIEAGVEALEVHLIEDGLSPLSRKPAACAVWAAMNKAATRRKGQR